MATDATLLETNESGKSQQDPPPSANSNGSIKEALISRATLIAACITAFMSSATVFFQAHSEHRYSELSRQAALLDKRIDLKTQLLNRFIVISNDLAAQRTELLFADLAASISVEKGLFRDSHENGRGLTKNEKSLLMEIRRERDLDDATKKQLDKVLELMSKTSSENSELLSTGTQAAIFFGARTREALSKISYPKYIESKALEEFKRNISPAHQDITPLAAGTTDELFAKISDDAAKDPLTAEVKAVLAAMADEIRKDTSIAG